MSQLLRLENVVAGYSRPVVGPATFTIEAGQVVGLGGHNGAGKSTILRAITGLARVFGGRITRAPGLTLAHQWQRPELPPELALLGRELFALLGADPEAAPAIVQPLMDYALYQLSGGQYQLLQALACVCSPARLVLMDEPTNNLDGCALEALSEMLRSLDPRRAVLLVSHETAFLEQHCTAMLEVRHA